MILLIRDNLGVTFLFLITFIESLTHNILPLIFKLAAEGQYALFLIIFALVINFNNFIIINGLLSQQIFDSQGNNHFVLTCPC